MDFESFLSDQRDEATAPPADALTAPATALAPPAQDTPFETFLRQAKGEQDQHTLQQAQVNTVVNAQQGTSAQAATAAPVARQLGLPPAAVETDLPRFQLQAKIEANTALLAKNPILARWVAANPDSARIAQDEYHQLATIEQTFSAGSSALGATGYAALQGLGSSYNSAALAVNRQIGNVLTVGGMGPNAASEWWQREMVAPREAAQQPLALSPDAGIGAKSANLIGNLLGMLSQITLTGGGGGEAAPASAGALETLAGAGQTAVRSMAFPSLTAATNKGADVFAQTGDQGAATRAALAEYAFTTAQGMIPFSAPGGIARRMATGAVSSVATSEGQRAAMNLLLPEALQQHFDPQEALFQAFSGAMLGGVMGPRAQPDFMPAIRQTYIDALRAEQAERDVGKVAALGQISAQSKLREADPSAFKSFVETVSDKSNLDAVYVDAREMAGALAQSKVDISQTMPDVAKQVLEGSVSGEDVRIPVADFATHIAGTDLEQALLPNMKAAPDGMTFKEGQAFYQDAAKTMTERATEIARQQVKDTALQQDKDAVRQQVYEQLVAAGRAPDIARTEAALHEAFYGTLGDNMGVKPSEAMTKFPLHVVSESPVGEAALADGSRGAYLPGGTVALLKGADLTTFAHESGHHFLEVMHQVVTGKDAPEGLKSDFDALLRHFKVDGATPEERLANWSAKTLDEKRVGHENFAESFEKYLMEGRAPTFDLQPMFSRFRSWMMNVYKSLRGLNVDLTPEVRGVFDRLLASDAAIKETEAARSYFPLFKTAEEAGMSKEQFASYVKIGQESTDRALDAMQAKSLADMKWAGEAKSKALRDLQRTAAGERKAIREEVTKELSDQPVRQAEAYLRREGGIDPAPAAAIKEWETTRDAQLASLREAVKAEYLASPEGAEVKGLKKGQFLARNKRAIDNEAERRVITWEQQNPRPARPKLDNDVIAEMFGFTDGKTLKAAMDAAGPLKEQIEQLTDARMLQRHGELLDPQAVEQAANDAVHNEARARFMATGLKALTKSPLPAAQIAKAAREAAETAIGGKRIMDLDARTYLDAETKANKEAIAAVAKDPQAAIQAQRSAVLSNRLAKASLDAVAEVQKGVRYLTRFDSATVRAKVDVEYRDQIDALLDRYDLRKSVSDKAVERRQSLRDFVEDQAAQGYEPNIPEALLNEANRKHYKEMTVDEFRGLVDAVKTVDNLGRLKNKLLDAQGERDLAEQVGRAVESMGRLPPQPPDSNRGLTRMEGAWMRTKAAGRSLQAALLKMEQMVDWLDDRKSTGPMNENVFRPIADAGVREANMMRDVKSRIDAFLHSGIEDITKDGGRIYTADGLVDSKTGKQARFTKKEMLALAGNWGNASNADKLARGERWNPDSVKAFLDANMTKADWDFVAGLGRTLESLWPEKVAMLRRLGNSTPDKVQPRPFDTPHGRYEGWYWPLVYDPARSQDVADRGARTGDALFENTYSKANTDTGRGNTRVEGYARPILLSLDAVPRVIKDEIHDIAFREAVLNADKFIRQPEVRQGVITALSQEHYDQLRPWLQSVANDSRLDTSNMRALKWFDALAHGARTRATIVGLGYRLSTMMVHGMSAGLESLAELGPKWFGAGLQEFANPTQWAANKDFVFERSGEMRNRMTEVDRDIRDHLREIDLRTMDPATGSIQRGSDIVKAHAYQGIAMLDMASALPTWMGAYLKAMTPAERGGMGLAETDAVYYADKTVRNAHGGTGVKDLAAVQRGSEFFKLFTMFYTFWNHNVNRIMDTGRMAGQLPATFRSGDMDRFRGDLGSVIMRTLIYTLGIQSMHGLLHPPKEGDDEDSWLKWAGKELTGAAFAGIPILRDISAHFLQGRDYSATPAASMVDALGKSGQDAMHAAVGEQVSDSWLKHSITTAGYVFGLPTGQAASAVQFLWDVDHGTQDPQNLRDWWSGLVHGRMQN